MTTLVRNFLHDVGTSLQDVSPQFRRWPERELVTYTNYGQLALAKYLPQVGARVDAIKLVPGTRQDIRLVPSARILPGDGGTPADRVGIAFLGAPRNMGANGAAPGRACRVVDRETLDVTDPLWHTRTGTEVYDYSVDKNTPTVFYVTPGAPASPGVWLEVSWMAEPDKVPAGGAPGSELYLHGGASTATLGVPDVFAEDLKNYVVAVALMKGSKNTMNLPKSQAHAQMFLASLNAQVAAITGTNPNLKVLPFAGDIPKSR